MMYLIQLLNAVDVTPAVSIEFLAYVTLWPNVLA